MADSLTGQKRESRWVINNRAHFTAPEVERAVNVNWLLSPSLLRATCINVVYGNEGSVRTWLIYFNMGLFCTQAFSSSGIHLPVALAQSVHKRQAEFFFGRAAARLGLESVGVYATPIPIGASREPVWPNGIIGSITHCSAVAAAAVSLKGAFTGVGIDIERIVDTETADEIVASVVDPEEMICMRESFSSASLPTLLTIAFSAKESFFKGAYGEVANFFDFDAVRIVKLDPRSRRIWLAVTETLSTTFLRNREFVVRFFFLADSRIMTCFAY